MNVKFDVSVNGFTNVHTHTMTVDGVIYAKAIVNEDGQGNVNIDLYDALDDVICMSTVAGEDMVWEPRLALFNYLYQTHIN